MPDMDAIVITACKNVFGDMKKKLRREGRDG